jgi:hypothetical protein
MQSPAEDQSFRSRHEEPRGTGIKGSAESRGATDKSTEDKTAPMGSPTGMSSGNAPGGTGVEQSSQGQGATNKN